MQNLPKNEFVVLPYKEFLELKEIVQDYEDLRDLREAREEFKHQPAIPLDEVINNLRFIKVA